MNVLFVCLGNICRSPSAEALLEQHLGTGYLHGIEVSSAGIHALVGEKSPASLLRALARRGIDLSGHCGRQVDHSLVQEADFILVMEYDQRMAIESLFPQAKGKVHLLGEFAPHGEPEIQDPFGGDEAEYEACLTRIEACMPRLLEHIRSHLITHFS